MAGSIEAASMSMARCADCGDLVDTDEELDCYGKDNQCRCESCIENLSDAACKQLYPDIYEDR
jgi:hypothetical protein